MRQIVYPGKGMRNRFHHIIVTLLLVTLGGLGSAQAGGGLCSAACALCAAPAAASCCDAMSSAGHEEVVSANPAVKSSAADCPHGELCSVMDYPADAGITSSPLFDAGVLLISAPVFVERPLLSYLQPDFLPHTPPDDPFCPLYIRNCSYLI